MVKYILLFLALTVGSSGAATLDFSWSYSEPCDGFKIYDEENTEVVTVGPDVRSATIETSSTSCKSYYSTALVGDEESKISRVVNWCPEPPKQIKEFVITVREI